MRRRLPVAALLAPRSFSPRRRPPAPPSRPAGVVPLSYLSPADGVERAYDLRIPTTWDGTSLLPAILLLHGRGGTKRQFQRTEYFDEADESGAVLVFWEGRRVPGGGGFPSTHYVDGADGVPDETDVLACLDDALARAPIDPDRVALAGLLAGRARGADRRPPEPDPLRRARRRRRADGRVPGTALVALVPRLPLRRRGRPVGRRRGPRALVRALASLPPPERAEPLRRRPPRPGRRRRSRLPASSSPTATATTSP